MSTEADRENIKDRLREVLDQAKIRSALFSDIILAISDMLGVVIHIMQREESEADWPKGATVMYTRVRDVEIGRQWREYFIFIPKLTRNNLPTVRFDVAHELGHIVLHRNGTHCEQFKASPGFPVYMDKHAQKQEIEADAFALGVLLLRGRILQREKLAKEEILRMVDRQYKKADMELIERLLEKIEHYE